MRYVLIVLALSLSSCTYNISQQQIGPGRSNRAAQAVGITNEGVSAGQTLGGTVVSPPPPPLSTYPEYNGYPGSGDQSSAASFFRGLFEGVVQINVGPGYGTDYGYYGGYGGEYHGPYGGGYAGPHRLHYPYYH